MCIDANLELADEDGVYDVFGYTKKLRAARKGMVETVVRGFPARPLSPLDGTTPKKPAPAHPQGKANRWQQSLNSSSCLWIPSHSWRPRAQLEAVTNVRC
ncbi:hypothetical protein HPB48_021733 [Haemaphysalis longicornis]|uniref:Uncharacterized protein n=1 Tax=Haemaphysalis longicornis TaxID=44386 RepID=A0A9J6FXI3_HAELO|nr:hypothetical protein HPB48_021733 [Haemaphysalis longicornis]